jgi:hypothetical protein
MTFIHQLKILIQLSHFKVIYQSHILYFILTFKFPFRLQNLRFNPYLKHFFSLFKRFLNLIELILFKIRNNFIRKTTN